MTRKEEIQKKSENELGTTDYQVGFSQGAQWADKTMIEKACEWLKGNANDYTWYNELGGESGLTDDFINDFRKAMEE